MDFRLDDARIELQRTIVGFAETRFPLDGVVAREGLPVDPAVWRELAELGLFGLLLPEDAGGSGLGVVDGAIVFEQLGAHLVPGPVLWTVLAASLLDGAAAGALRAGGLDSDAVIDARDGGAASVENAADLDVLLILHGDRVTAHRTAELDRPEVLVPLDPLTPVGRFRGLEGGELVGGPADAAELRLRGTVLSAAMLTGVASRALDVARAHARERHQFGVPIGSFQAVKHLLADMLVRSSLAQSATYAAAAMAQEPGRDDPVQAAAAAKLLAGDAAIANASSAIQVLGGMGFTWDMPPNHLLKRAWVLEQGFGTADHHALQLGTRLAAAR